MVRSKLRILGLVTVAVTVLAWLAGTALDSSFEKGSLAAAERGVGSGESVLQTFTLNALDYRMNIYNFYKPGLGYSTQIDHFRYCMGNPDSE